MFVAFVPFRICEIRALRVLSDSLISYLGGNSLLCIKYKRIPRMGYFHKVTQSYN